MNHSFSAQGLFNHSLRFRMVSIPPSPCILKDGLTLMVFSSSSSSSDSRNELFVSTSFSSLSSSVSDSSASSCWCLLFLAVILETFFRAPRPLLLLLQTFLCSCKLFYCCVVLVTNSAGSSFHLLLTGGKEGVIWDILAIFGSQLLWSNGVLQKYPCG